MSRQHRRAQRGLDVRTPLTSAGNLFNITDSDIALAQGCASLAAFFINVPEMSQVSPPEQLEDLRAAIEQDVAIIDAYAEATQSLQGGETMAVDMRIPLAMLTMAVCARNFYQLIQSDAPQVESAFDALAAEKGVSQAAVIELCHKLAAMARAASPRAGAPA